MSRWGEVMKSFSVENPQATRASCRYICGVTARSLVADDMRHQRSGR